jgi:hypothetical protein
MEWIEEAERELDRRIDSRLFRKRQEMRAELAAIYEIRIFSITKNSGRIIKEIDKNTEIFFIKK